MEMKYLLLERIRDIPYVGILRVIEVGAGRYEDLCFVIDPCILAEGRYNLEMCYSPKFKMNLPLIYNDKFPASRGFRIHSGNSIKDTKGCILTGDSITYRNTLVNSKKALERVIRAIKDYDIHELVVYEECD